jgi:hypothetical protein
MLNINMRIWVLIILALLVLALYVSCGNDKSTDGPTVVPSRPDNPRATALSPISALLEWDDLSNNEDLFAIHRAEKGPFSHIASTAANVNAFVDTLLDDSSSYRYYIVASNSAGSSAPSETVSVTTPASGFPPVAPRFPSPGDDSIGVPLEVILMWQCADPDGDTLIYDLYFGSGSYLNLQDSNLAATNYALDSLDYGIRYNWKVVAWDDDRHHTDSPVWHFATADSVNSDTSFVITVEISGQGQVAVDPDLPRFSPGDTVTLTAMPTAGWYFWGWSGDTSGATNPLIFAVTHDYHVIANFEEVADTTTTRIGGVVTWPGHSLSNRAYAFADSFYQDTLRLVAQADVDPADGRFVIIIPNQSDTLYIEFQGQDDINGNGPWDPIDPVDGWGFYDANGDSIRNDYFLIPPGTHMDSVKIVLRSANER